MPATVTATNQNRPNTGLNVVDVPVRRSAIGSSAPPIPAMDELTREDEELVPPQVDADRLRRGLGVAHGRRACDRAGRCAGCGRAAGQGRDDQLEEVEGRVAGRSRGRTATADAR